MVDNKFIIKDFWLMFKSPCRGAETYLGSPLIDKDIYDGVSPGIRGVAVQMHDGRKMVVTREYFDKEKIERDGFYYLNKWNIYG